jgi:hypothetical protein
VEWSKLSSDLGVAEGVSRNYRVCEGRGGFVVWYCIGMKEADLLIDVM